METGGADFSIFLEVLEVEKGIDGEGVANLEVTGPFKGFVNVDSAHFNFLIGIKMEFRDEAGIFNICKMAAVAKDRRIGRAVGKEAGIFTDISGFFLKFSKTGGEGGFTWVNNSTRNFPRQFTDCKTILSNKNNFASWSDCYGVHPVG